MRNLIFYFLTVCLLWSLNTQPAKAVNSEENTAVIASKPIPTDQIQVLKNRLEEIKAIDKNSLTKIQKKELRKEKQAIKQELRAVTGIYISIGALIIIVLLLILILD